MITQPYIEDIDLCGNAKFCKEDKNGVSIIYAYEDSDVFYPAKLLKHGINCLCFASKKPIEKGKRVYILTQDFPIEGDSLKIYEGCFAQIQGCKKNNNFKKRPSYLIQGESISGMRMSVGSNELSTEVLSLKI
jgi:hypothetical protein